MKRFSRTYLIALLLLLPVLFIASWIGSIYDRNIHNLLDTDGVRWGVTHVLDNYSRLPVTLIIILLVVISAVIESGWMDFLFRKNRPLMLKQLRAHTYTNLTGILLLAIFGSMLLVPASPLLNAFGGFRHSPLSEGWFMLLMLLILLLANIYGYLSGQLTTFPDFVYAHTRLLRRYSFSFITLFVVAQVCGCLDYSNIIALSVPYIDEAVMAVLALLCFVG